MPITQSWHIPSCMVLFKNKKNKKIGTLCVVTTFFRSVGLHPIKRDGHRTIKKKGSAAGGGGYYRPSSYSNRSEINYDFFFVMQFCINDELLPKEDKPYDSGITYSINNCENYLFCIPNSM